MPRVDLKITAKYIPEEYSYLLEGKPPAYVDGTAEVLAFQQDDHIAIVSHTPGRLQADIHLYNSLNDELLQEIETTLISRGCTVLTLKYPADEPLPVQGWDGPAPFLTRYHFGARAFNPPWFQNIPVFSKGITSTPWSELTDEEEKMLIHWIQSGRVNSDVNPFNWPEPLELTNSLLLRDKGAIIGWIITHRILPDTLRYSVIFTFPEYRKKGEIIKLLASAIRIHKDSTIPYGIFETLERHSSPDWEDFIQSRLAPFAQKITQINILWKRLT